MKINEDGWDIYFIPNMVKASFVGIKPSDADIKFYSRFVVDLDPIPGATRELLGNEAFEDVRLYGNVLYSIVPTPMHPLSIVYTGNGAQLHYMINTNQFTLGNKESIRGKVSWLLHELGIHPVRLTSPCISPYRDTVFMTDTCTSDPSRMVRFPYTINHKTGVRGYVEQLRYTECDISQWPERVASDSPEPFDGDITNLSQVAPRLTNTALTFLTLGVNRERHASAYAAAASLRSAGVNKEVANEMVAAGGMLCVPPLVRRETEHCVKQAYKNNSA